MRYDPTQYLYASARVRAMEARLWGKQAFARFLSAATADEILDDLTESAVVGDRTQALTEGKMREALRAVADSVPDSALIRFVQYPYDCHNLKVIEKCRHKGISPDGLLIDLGSVDTKTLLTVSENEYLPLFPTHLREAVPACQEAFAKTTDPQEIDFILDRAAFADMGEAAAPFPLAREWVAAKADLQNLLSCLRLLRMQSAELGRSVLERSALPCGTIPLKSLLDCYDGGEEALIAALARTPYRGLFEKNTSLGEAECAADDHLMALIRRTKAIPFGAEIPVSYLLACEAEIKNLRILLAGKRAGLDARVIEARLRDCYA